VTVWTIDAEPGTGGRDIAERLAEAADVPLVDELRAEDAAGRLVRYGLAFGLATGAACELALELERLKECRAALERAASTVARTPCVILGPAARAALAAHPGALHVGIHAPRDWRARRLAATRCLPLTRARRELARADRRRRRAANGSPPFHVVCDASRLRPDTIVELLVASAP
jgi:cytidylate kinase-like protein